MNAAPQHELPTVLVTGASGFLGRRVVQALQEHHQVIALDWRPPDVTCSPEHRNVRWIQADIADAGALLRLALDTPRGSPPQLLLHLAAHYEFEQEDEAPYWRTNVEGLRNVLEAAVAARIPRFVFASSLAACAFPHPGEALTEQSPPDGAHVYARTKRAGEQMLREYSDRMKCVIVRFAAMFSDYCEYPPLYKFLETWLSRAWNRRILGGRGASAIPFLHVRDAARMVRTVIRRFDTLDDGEVLIASPDGCTSHLELYEAATEAYFHEPREALFVPKLLVRPGIRARLLVARLTGNMPFERPWMADFVDRQMRVDGAHTRARIGWAPRQRLGILERMPMLIENLRAYPAEWQHRNLGALHKTSLRPNLVIHGLIQRHRDEIGRRLSARLTEESQALESYQRLGAGDHQWNHRLALNALMQSVRTRRRKIFIDYCSDLAERRFEQGFSVSELTSALRTLEKTVLEVLLEDAHADVISEALPLDVSVTVRFAIDEVEEVFEDLQANASLAPFGDPTGPLPVTGPERERDDEHQEVSEAR